MSTVPASSAWSPLGYTTFRWLWLASIASNIGTWMHEVGAGWLMTSLSASPMHVALVQVVGSAPMFFLALPAGALADIVDRRRYLLLVQMWMAAVAMTLALLTLGGQITVNLLLLLTLGMGIGTALMMPAWSALTPELVDKADLPAAIALSSVGVNVARAIGPAIAGVLVSLSGPWATFALNALSFFAVIAVLFFWRREVAPAVLPAERLAGAIRAGWRYSRSSRPLQAVMGPAQDPEFVLYHADNVEASGFVQHLKLPHYVDFQSELDMVRRLRRAHGERRGGHRNADDQGADDQDAEDQNRDAAE